jgi:LPS-assembly lipoprotein
MQKIILMLIFIALTSCGYHLRGAFPMAAPLHHLYIKTSDPYGQLARDLRQSLKVSNLKIVDKPENATAILDILDEQDTQQLVSISGTQRIQQYNLIINVNFQVTDTHGKVLVPAQSVNETRALTIKADQILGGSNEANNLYQQMRQAIVFDSMNRLSSKDITALLGGIYYDHALKEGSFGSER